MDTESVLGNTVIHHHFPGLEISEIDRQQRTKPVRLHTCQIFRHISQKYRWNLVICQRYLCETKEREEIC